MLIAPPSRSPPRLPWIVAIANFLLAVTFAALLFTSTPAPSAEASAPTTSLHALFSAGGALANAKYIDLTHAIQPGMDLWAGFNQPNFGPALATEQPGFATAGEPFSYGAHGFIATDVHLHTDQIGTQLDPPAHWNEYGATISDVPASVSLRPLVVIDVTAQVAADPTYFATVADVEAHEAAHGRIPAGSAVFFRTDWSRGWEGYDGSETMPSVGLDALKLLHLERGVLVHGHEPLDTSTTPNMAEEAWLMHANFLQIEGATNLHLLPPTGCLLSIGFAKILGGAGGYARLIAVCPEDWAHGVTVATHPGAPLPTQSFPLRRGAGDGVLRPTEGAAPTEYCAAGSAAAGCPLPV